jgi:hypothetical protein
MALMLTQILLSDDDSSLVLPWALMVYGECLRYSTIAPILANNIGVQTVAESQYVTMPLHLVNG